MKSTIFSRTAATWLLGASIATLPVFNAKAANEIYLKFPGIEGEVTRKGHEKEIGISGFSANASRTGNFNGGGGGGGSGRVTCGQITLSKVIDQSSPKFLGLLFSGRITAGPALLSFEKSGEGPHVDYYTIELADISVMGVSQTDPEDTIVTEKIVLQAGRYRYTYTPQDPKGGPGNPVTFGWDCRRNVAF